MIPTVGNSVMATPIDYANAKSGSLPHGGVPSAAPRKEERQNMPGATELPQMVTEFVDLSKEYLRQETVEPAKRLGRFAGFAIGGAMVAAIGAVLLAIAGVRFIIYLLPSGPNWEALGYILAAVVIALVIGAMVGITSSNTDTKEV